ncbi:MAG: DUF1987 domain-containing protein [Bacteroidales bacterium]|jgi:hypothetical protein|nr:DUF1987 domain-containing protein [Bacteroidales bacterium]MDY0254074.1 DUF1987 domain-containing protein [Tenuifilaceae bacterium]
MEKIVIEPTNETPKVVLDKDNSIFEFSGNSLPEDVSTFFFPILSWFDEYAKAPNPTTQVKFNFEYYNTSSSKMILKLLEKFRDIHRSGFDVEVHWHYLEDDEDMIEAGEDYSENIKVPFKFIAHSR